MRASPPTWSIGRATIAVVALYALCLQLLLGAIAPVSVQAASGPVICHPDQAGDPAEAPGTGARCALPCCVAPHHLPFVAPVLLAFTRLTWEGPSTADRFPPAADESPARAPPDANASPRGPPQA